MPEDQGLEQALDTRNGINTQAADRLRKDRNTTAHVPATSGATLLPRSLASLISFIAQSTSLSLRLGTYFGGAALGGARLSTLTGLELSRALLEGVLTRAGHDVGGRSHGEYGRLEAESLLERSVSVFFLTRRTEGRR
jgi:hypothetical protein